MDAIKKVEGPCVVLAGAGTGKTFTIVEKLKYIVSNGIYKPEKIVCITFSNEAANNLTIRIQKALNLQDSKNSPIIRTFHGFSADLLRKYGDRIGIPKDFKIIDTDQAKVLLHRNLKVTPINCHRYISSIGTSKDLGIKIEEFKEYLDNQLKKYPGIDLEKRLENLQFELQTLHLKKEAVKKKVLVNEIKNLRQIIEIKKFVSTWNAYEKIKQKGSYQDYSDLNKNSLELLEKNQDISLDFDYLIIDEFQDTNKIQLDFVVNLARHANITVVGDLNQSIYRFRGAYKENMNIFKKFFNVSSKDVFNLDKSYRSSNKILKVAHQLISNNYQNKEECFFVENVHNRNGDNIEIYEMKNAKEEARKVVELIKGEVEKGCSLEDICIIFRAHQYGRIIKRALEKEGIKYSSVAKASLLKQKSVKTAHDYLIILNKLKRKDKGGEQAWWDLIYQLDFSPEDLIKIGMEIKKFYKNDEVNKDIISVYLFNNLEKLQLSDSGKIAIKVLIDRIKLMLPALDKNVGEIVQEVYRISGLIKDQKTREAKEIMLNLNKFYEIAKIHEDLYDSDLNNFIYYLEILENLGIEIEASQFEDGGVKLMTSHATKGLEYKIVIITNMAQGRFPIERYSNNSLIPTELLPEIKEELKGLSEEEKEGFVIQFEKHNQLLEERRLAYVSFTRSKEKLILTYASQYGDKNHYPSQFLNEISFKNNIDISYSIDSSEKYLEEEVEIKKASDFGSVLSSNNFHERLNGLVLDQNKNKEKEETKHFSPSALLLFEECQKQFEYKYVYNMPEKKTISWEAMRLGSFVHLVLELGVSKCFNTIEEYLQLVKEMILDEEWGSINYDEAERLIKVFFERNKGRYDENSKTEQYLSLNLDGLNFIGYADRIDFRNDGAEIVDYKTGASAIAPKNRNWQLGFYALAAKEKYGNVRKVVLDMLKQDKPLEFEIDSSGNAHCLSSDRMPGFNIYQVRDELINAANDVKKAYESGFKPCQIEKNCEFCNEYVYNL